MTPEFPDISIVVPNWNGKHHLQRCFESLASLRYAGRVEMILVDNGSEDGSAEFVRRRFPEVTIISNQTNEGFSRACNAGARKAETPLVAFLNNDMRVDPDWITELVKGMEDQVRCTTSLTLSWDGKRVNFGGGGMNFHGIGIQVGLDDPDIDSHRTPGDSLFGCGGAMAMDRELFLEVGGFDDDFFAYYEDVDLGWRLWVLGERVKYCPASVAYHHHSATARRVDVHLIRRLQVRNPLFTIFKNYDDENLKRALPAALLLTLRRTRYMLAVDESRYSLENGGRQNVGGLGALVARLRARLIKARVPMAGVADIMAVNDLMDGFKALESKRSWIQERRKRTDAEIVGLFRDPRWPAESPEEYLSIQDDLFRFFGLDEALL